MGESSACFINVEEQHEVVRSLLLAFLLLAAPLPVGELTESEVFFGQEVVLRLSENQVWSQQDWSELSVFGYDPLRLVTPSELLAWKSAVDAKHPRASESDAMGAIWKSIPIDGQLVRIVFEPGLPTHVVEHVQQQIQQYGNNVLGSIDQGFLPSMTIVWTSESSMEQLADIEGILWLEPQLLTEGRNLESAKLLTQPSSNAYPSAWTHGLNGSGVVIGVADTGIDSDHSCFRNISEASIGFNHRKLLHVNTTIDDWDIQDSPITVTAHILLGFLVVIRSLLQQRTTFLPLSCPLDTILDWLSKILFQNKDGNLQMWICSLRNLQCMEDFCIPIHGVMTLRIIP